MTMQCEKTGFHALLGTGEYVVGDAFKLGDEYWLFRIVAVSNQPFRDLTHFRIDTWERWFNQDTNHGTMICTTKQVEYLGYDGIPT